MLLQGTSGWSCVKTLGKLWIWMLKNYNALHHPERDATVKEWIPTLGGNWCQVNLRGYMDLYLSNGYHRGSVHFTFSCLAVGNTLFWPHFPFDSYVQYLYNTLHITIHQHPFPFHQVLNWLAVCGWRDVCFCVVCLCVWERVCVCVCVFVCVWGFEANPWLFTAPSTKTERFNSKSNYRTN